MDALRDLQSVELDILKQVLKISQRHNLTYYMLGGTLLGAVRHKGFIPWDDDIDIGLPRPDYERFLEYAQYELEMPYQLHTISQNSGAYCYYYARVENTKVKLVRKAAINEAVIPAWIDVFPLDGVPNDPKKNKKWLKRVERCNTIFRRAQLSYLGNTQTPSHRNVVKKAFVKLRLDKLISTKWAWKRLDAVLKENKYYECDILINACGYWKLKEMFPKSVYGKGKLYPFEGLMLNGPEDYDYVLKQMYGDYMTPPPENAREHHFIELIADNGQKA